MSELGCDAPLLPVLVGVTGHRDLRVEDRSALEAAVNSVLEQIERGLPHAPITLLSPLAEGADRLVARCALQRGWSLVVPMPMARAAYVASFSTAAARDEFAELLNRAERVFEIDTVTFDSEAEADARDGDAGAGVSTAGAAYQRLGLFLVRHAQILIALWDGRATSERGGTDWVVEVNRLGYAEGYDGAPMPLDQWDSGPCYHVMTPRAGGAPAVGAPGEIRIIHPEPHGAGSDARERSLSEARHRRILERIDEFDRDITRGGAALLDEAERAAGDLLPPALQRELGEGQALLRRFGLADALANRMQHRYRRGFMTLLGLVLAALVGFEVYENLMPDDREGGLTSMLVLAAYPLALGLAFVGYTIMNRRQYHDKYLDYRALSEGLRVQIFWRLAGLRQQVSDHYLRKQNDDLRWIHEAVRVSNVMGGAPVVDDDDAASRAESVVGHWIDSECAYFQRACARDASKLRRASRLALVCYATSLGATLVVILMDGAALLGGLWLAWPNLRDYAFVGIGLTLGASALVRAYSEKRGFGEQALQYQRMRDLLVRAARGTRTAIGKGDFEAFRRLILELGEEALRENADWVLFRRSQRIDLPQG